MREGMQLSKLFNFVNGHVEKIRSHLASISGSIVKVANSAVVVQCNGPVFMRYLFLYLISNLYTL
jgi:hypothetical protein